MMSDRDNFKISRIRKLEERDRDKQAAIQSAFKHLEPFARRDTVPIEALEDLAEMWDKGEAADEACASELRELIAEYGDGDD